MLPSFLSRRPPLSPACNNCATSSVVFWRYRAIYRTEEEELLYLPLTVYKTGPHIDRTVNVWHVKEWKCGQHEGPQLTLDSHTKHSLLSWTKT